MLVTTLTKRMAEDLAEYYSEVGVRCRYLHSEVSTLDRIKILRDLRRGEFDVLIGINLLREGLDLAGSLAGGDSGCRQRRLPALQRLADSDHGTRRAPRGRPRHPLRRCDDRQHAQSHRAKPPGAAASQLEYNERNGITPQSIIKPIDMSLVAIAEADYVTVPLESDDEIEQLTQEQRERFLGELEERMREAARKFEFEKAAQIRDKLKALRASSVEGITAAAGNS